MKSKRVLYLDYNLYMWAYALHIHIDRLNSGSRIDLPLREDQVRSGQVNFMSLINGIPGIWWKRNL